MPEVLASVAETIAPTIRQLSLDTLRQLIKSRDSNVVISGSGFWTALMVLLAGAEGATADELSRVLGFRAEEAADAVNNLERHLATLSGFSESTTLLARIPIWRKFQESLPSLTFGGLDNQESLDSWASARTNGLIPRFPIQITEETLAVLANVIYAKGRWIEKFPAAEDGPFAKSDGTVLSTAFMQRIMSAHYFTQQDDLVEFRTDLVSESERQAPRLQVRFYIGPIHLDPVQVFQRALTLAPGDRIDADRVRLSLPKFSVRQTHDLKDLMQTLGVTDVFEDRSSLPLISPEPLKISQAIQESVFNVDEEGVEAASITAMSARLGSAGPRTEPKIIDIKFDRPFAFALFEPKAGVPLFIGWIADPTK